MKKIVILSTLGLALLTACSSKNKEADKESDKSLPQETLVWNRTEEESNQESTKTLIFPEVDGVLQKQTIHFKGKQWLGLTLDQTQPAGDEVKNALEQVGLEETQRALENALEQDENYQAVKSLAGFNYSIKVTEDQKLQLVTTYDFTQFQVAKMKDYPYFKESNIPDMMKESPSQYIQTRINNGAKLAE